MRSSLVALVALLLPAIAFADTTIVTVDGRLENDGALHARLSACSTKVWHLRAVVLFREGRVARLDVQSGNQNDCVTRALHSLEIEDTRTVVARVEARSWDGIDLAIGTRLIDLAKLDTLERDRVAPPPSESIRAWKDADHVPKDWVDTIPHVEHWQKSFFRGTSVSVKEPSFDRSVDASIVVDGGGLEREEIGRVVKARAGIFRACYQKALVRWPDLEGRLLVKFEIDGTGAVSSSTTLGTYMMIRVSGCIEANVKRLRFPARGTTSKVTYPMNYFLR